MSRIKEFFFGLSKSTKITLISCGGFVLLTLVILLFFVLFPITPTEKAIAKFGREGLYYQDGEDAAVTTTTSTAVTGTATVTTTQTSVTVTTDEMQTFTTPTGFFFGGNIQTGNEGETYRPNETTTETVAPQEPEPTTEPPELPIEEVTDPVPTSPVEIVTTAPPTEPPTAPPTEAPTEAPTPAPTEAPTEAPTPAPTDPPAAEQ